MTELKGLYYISMRVLCFLYAILKSIKKKEAVTSDLYQMICNLIEQFDELYINAESEEDMYWKLTAKICDVTEFIEVAEEKNPVVCDAFTILINLLENLEDIYINAEEKSYAMC